MKKERKKRKEVLKKIIPSDEEIGKMLDSSEFAQKIYVNWGDPLGTKPIKSKPKLKSKEIKKYRKGGKQI